MYHDISKRHEQGHRWINEHDYRAQAQVTWRDQVAPGPEPLYDVTVDISYFKVTELSQKAEMQNYPKESQMDQEEM